MMKELSDYLTINEAAKRRGVSRQAVQDLISRGRLKARRLGRQWLIHRLDLSAYKPDPGGRPKRTKSSRKQ
jgi:excisionase family DNA binding protein